MPKRASELTWEAQKFQTFLGKDAPRQAEYLKATLGLVKHLEISKELIRESV